MERKIFIPVTSVLLGELCTARFHDVILRVMIRGLLKLNQRTEACPYWANVRYADILFFSIFVLFFILSCNVMFYE